jgi:hypothetical protein
VTAEAKQRVLRDIEHEGFDYTFESYDHYEDIKDPAFHRLRLAYLRAAKELRDFLEHP